MSNLGSWSIGQELYSWLLKNLEEGKTIVEFGSGRGTIELTKKWEVYTIEHDKKWLGVAPKANYIYAPLRFDGWYDSEKVFSGLPEKYDCIIVDGPVGPKARLGIDKHWDKLNTDVPIIFDDTNRMKDKLHALKVATLLKKDYIEITERYRNSTDRKRKKFMVLINK